MDTLAAQLQKLGKAYYFKLIQIILVPIYCHKLLEQIKTATAGVMKKGK